MQTDTQMNGRSDKRAPNNKERKRERERERKPEKTIQNGKPRKTIEIREKNHNENK